MRKEETEAATIRPRVEFLLISYKPACKKINLEINIYVYKIYVFGASI